MRLNARVPHIWPYEPGLASLQIWSGQNVREFVEIESWGCPFLGGLLPRGGRQERTATGAPRPFVGVNGIKISDNLIFVLPRAGAKTHPLPAAPLAQQSIEQFSSHPSQNAQRAVHPILFVGYTCLLLFDTALQCASSAMTLQHIVSWRLLFLPVFVVAGLFLLVLQAPLFLLLTCLLFLAYLLWLVFG
jgi:hypothetical protein